MPKIPAWHVSTPLAQWFDHCSDCSDRVKKEAEKKNVSYILSGESFDKSLMEQCEAFSGTGLGDALNWKEAKGQKSEGL